MNFKPAFFFWGTFLAVILKSMPLFAGVSPQEKHLEVALRMIGHRLLLSEDDRTSRVLPIVYEFGRYKISFENNLAISPGKLVQILGQVATETDFPENFILEVESCDSNKVVYAYEVSSTNSHDIIPCIGRELPKACYTLYFTATSAIIAANAKDSNDFSWFNLIIALGVFILLVITGVVYFYLWKKKNSVGINPNWISLGKYHFDKLNAQLIIEEQRIELTSKEADLLMILYEMVNTTVEKEVLLNKVWGDEGDYIGRTLDVFISKLRKKLEFDAQLKIVNVRGVGYKLILND